MAARAAAAAHLAAVAAEASGHPVAQVGAAAALPEDALAVLAAAVPEVTEAWARGTAGVETWATVELVAERAVAEKGRL